MVRASALCALIVIWYVHYLLSYKDLRVTINVTDETVTSSLRIGSH